MQRQRLTACNTHVTQEGKLTPSRSSHKVERGGIMRRAAAWVRRTTAPPHRRTAWACSRPDQCQQRWANPSTAQHNMPDWHQPVERRRVVQPARQHCCAAVARQASNTRYTSHQGMPHKWRCRAAERSSGGTKHSCRRLPSAEPCPAGLNAKQRYCPSWPPADGVSPLQPTCCSSRWAALPFATAPCCGKGRCKTRRRQWHACQAAGQPAKERA